MKRGMVAAGAAILGVAAGSLFSIRVTNQWPNRLIYDSSLPAEKRLTRTNINPYKPKSKLMRSGLFGPVRILEEKEK